MIKLIPLNPEHLKELIRFSYEGDTDLIETYQAEDRTFEECVNFNCEEIMNHLNDPVFKGDIDLWSIEQNEKPIGYCVTITNEEKPNMLLSCAINIKHRRKENLTQWLQEVEKKIGSPYYIGLWNRNSRAINFFQRNGFTPFPAKELPYQYLVKDAELLERKKIFSWQYQQQ